MTEYRIVSLKKPDSPFLTYIVQRKNFWWWVSELTVESNGKKQPFEFQSGADAEKFILSKVLVSSPVGGTIAHYVID